jgi:hypothetical protein
VIKTGWNVLNITMLNGFSHTMKDKPNLKALVRRVDLWIENNMDLPSIIYMNSSLMRRIVEECDHLYGYFCEIETIVGRVTVKLDETLKDLEVKFI